MIETVGYLDKNLGDNLVHLNWLRRVALNNPDRVFRHICRDDVFPQLRPLVAGVTNLRLEGRPWEVGRYGEWHHHDVVDGAINCWKGRQRYWFDHAKKFQFIPFYLEFFELLAKDFDVQNPVLNAADFLFDFHALHAPVGNSNNELARDILIVNSRPHSGQWDAFHPETLAALAVQLSKRWRVITTEPVAGLWCTAHGNMDVTAIGRVSNECKVHLMVSTGPSWLTFNRFNQCSVALRILLIDHEDLTGLSSNLRQARTVADAETILKELSWL